MKVFINSLKNKQNLLGIGIKNFNLLNKQFPKFFTIGSSSDKDSSKSTSSDNKNSSSSSSSQSQSQDKNSDLKSNLKQSGGQESFAGGMSEVSGQSYATQDPMGTLNYMKTQFQEDKNQPIDKLIIGDHTLVRTIYDKFKTTINPEEQAKWRNELVYEIARHSIAEELILYPLIRDNFPDGEKLYQDSINEHHHVKENLYQAEHTNPYTPEFKTKVNDVMEVLVKHMDKEEKEMLPMLLKYISEEKRIKAGNQFMRRKLIVPTRPHTMIPEDPPTLNSLLGLLTAPIDKFRDLFNSFPDQNKMADVKKEAASQAKSHEKSESTNKDSSSGHIKH